MAINDVLPKLREQRGLTQQELAHKLYVTRQAVSRWENGETTPGIDMVKLMAVALEVRAGMLPVRGGRGMRRLLRRAAMTR